jgi:hypothetical protein
MAAFAKAAPILKCPPASPGSDLVVLNCRPRTLEPNLEGKSGGKTAALRNKSSASFPFNFGLPAVNLSCGLRGIPFP